MKIIVVIGVVWSVLCLLLKPASCGNLISEPPHDLTLPLSSDAIFTCRANTSYNITRISWIIGARDIDLEYYSYEDGYGISVTHSSMNLSILSVSGLEANSGTTVKCTVSANDGPTIEQSPMAVLTLYGPPSPIVNFNVQDVGPMSLRLSWEPLMFPQPQIPFNYTLNISGPNDTNEIIELPQNASNYTYRADQDGDCQLYTFTLKAMNSAGYSEPETLIRGIADAPGNLSSNISHKVFFNDSLIRVNISVLSPDVCQYYPITSYLLEYHDITNSTQSIYSTSHEIISTDHTSNHFISHDNHVTLSVNGTQLDLNRRYTIYITAANDIGATDTQEIEIITSHLQDFSAVLVGDILTVTCQFGVGTPMDVECTVMIYIGDVLVDNVTIDKNTSANDAVSHDFKSSQFNTSSLLIIAYDHQESPLKFTAIISPPTPTPTLVQVTSATGTSMGTTSFFTTNFVTPTRTLVSVNGAVIGGAVGGVVVVVLLIVIIVIIVMVAVIIAVMKNKTKEMNNPSSSSSSSPGPPLVRDNVAYGDVPVIGTAHNVAYGHVMSHAAPPTNAPVYESIVS